MNPSETVQAAQRLLAERERVGLAKYGVTVDRTDLSPEQWLTHMRDELSDGLLYAMRALQTLRDRSAGPAPEFIVSPIVCPDTPDAHTLTLKIGVQSFRIGGGLDYDTREDAEWTARMLLRALANMQQPSLCECRNRPSALCRSTLEPGCDMGANEAHAVPAGEDSEAALKKAKDAERAAYLARWKDAPEWAEWVSQDGHRWCVWHERQPHEQGSFWRPDGAAKVAGAGHNLLGSVRCEPRPRQGEGL